MSGAALFQRRRRRAANAASAAVTLLTDPNLVWWHEAGTHGSAQTGTDGGGIAYQWGSTSGADTNDYTAYNAVAPASYQMGVDDWLTAFSPAALQNLWADPTGWTVLVAVRPNATDVGAGRNFIHCTSGAATAMRTGLSAGRPRLNVYYGGGSVNNDRYDVVSALAASTDVVIAYGYDPTQARATRGKIWRDGVVDPTTGTSVGSDGTVSAIATETRLGYESTFTVLPTVDLVYGWYAYRGQLATPTVAAYTAEARTRLGI